MSMTLAEIYFNPYFLAFLVVQFACWGLLTRMFRGVHLLNVNPVDTANKFVNLGVFCWLGFYGGYTWFFDPGFAETFAEERLLGDYAPSRTVFHAIIASMIFDTTMLIIARAGPEFFAHHICVFILANLALTYGGPEGEPAGLYYGTFFFGVTELSSIPLSVVDMMRGKKDLGRAYERLECPVRLVFMAFFFAVRIFYWPFVLVDFFINLYPQALAGVFPVWLVAMACTMAVGLTALQWVWIWLIIKGWLKVLHADTDGELFTSEFAERCGL